MKGLVDDGFRAGVACAVVAGLHHFYPAWTTRVPKPRTELTGNLQGQRTQQTRST